ncbi:MAG: M1 family aminopeptidase [Paraclostridium sp.]
MNKYDIDLTIDTENKVLSALINLKYISKREGLKELLLYIHKNMEFEYISCDKKIDYEIISDISNKCSFILESKLIKIQFKESLNFGENINLIFKYKGFVDIVNPYGINRITNEWVELGLYTPWFPLVDTLEPSLFNVKIMMDKDYEVVNSKYEFDRFVLEQKIPFIDCTIISSRSFKIIKNSIGNTYIYIYYVDEQHSNLAQKISEISKYIMKQYSSFGYVETEKLSIVIAQREDGGGYCRPNLVVVTPDDEYKDEIEYFKFIAHELAHIWWNKGNVSSWEDWLNESFAEYSALIAIRDNFGEKYFNNIINIYKDEAKHLPPIKNIDRSDNNAYSVLYKKGSLVLNELEDKVGRDKFKEILATIHMNKIDTTDKLLDLLDSRFGKKLKEHIKKLLS